MLYCVQVMIRSCCVFLGLILISKYQFECLLFVNANGQVARSNLLLLHKQANLRPATSMMDFSLIFSPGQQMCTQNYTQNNIYFHTYIKYEH
jgi:hypothetical protein